MKQSQLIGNRHIVSSFVASVKEGRVASAYLIEGPAGSGKRTLAELLAALLVCTNVGEEGACLACRDCENVLCGSHPDVCRLLPEKEQASISVDVVRRANEIAMSAPIHAVRRVFIVENAAQMNAAAQNALLKNLEEPRSSSVYLLLCEEAAGVLATIRSRCVTYRMELLSETVQCEFLRRHFPKEREEDLALAARLSGGVLGQAMDFFSNKKSAEVRRRATEYLSLICKNAPFDAFCALVPADTKKDFLPLFYRILLSGVRDLLCAQESAKRSFFAPEELLVCKKSKPELLLICERLCDLMDPAMANANVAASLYSLHAVAASKKS